MRRSLAPIAVPASMIRPGYRLGATTCRTRQSLARSIAGLAAVLLATCPEASLADLVIETVAGTGADGSAGDGGPAIAAQIDAPVALAIDAGGNLFIAELGGRRVRRVDVATGLIMTVAGTGGSGPLGDGGPATAAVVGAPYDVAVDGSGNVLIADGLANRVRRVDAATGIITTLAGGGSTLGDGGPATLAGLSQPAGVAVDTPGNVFIADGFNQRIRRVDAVSGIITTVAGNGFGGSSGDGGPAVDAQLAFPAGVDVDAVGNLFIVEIGGMRIRRVDALTGTIDTVAGNGTEGFSGDGGPAALAQLRFPSRVKVDGAGNLFIADKDNHRVRNVDAASGIISTLAGAGGAGFEGDGGPPAGAWLNQPQGVAVDSQGNVYVADTLNNRIRRIRPACVDWDGDSVCNDDDNCISEPNMDQLDADGDGHGDVCDPCPAETSNECSGVVPLGGEFQVNVFTTDYQVEPSVTVAPNGEFVVVWRSYGGFGPQVYGNSIQGRRFGADGVGSSQFQVNSDVSDRNYCLRPSVGASPDGGFFVAWEDDDDEDLSVEVRRFDQSGTPAGAEVRVDDGVNIPQYLAAAALDSGDFIVVWEDRAPFPFLDHPLHGRLVDASGMAVGSEFSVAPTLGLGSAWRGLLVSSVPDVGFVVAWSDDDDVLAANVFDETATSISGEFIIPTEPDDGYGFNTYSTGLAGGDGGDFLVTWYAREARVFDAAGSPTGTPVTFVPSYPNWGTAARLPGKGFVVVWQDLIGLSARLLDENGFPIGSPFQVNESAVYTEDARVAADGAGHFVIVWEQEDDGSDHGIVARRFVAADAAAQCTPTTACAPETTVTGTAANTPGTVTVNIEPGDLSAPAVLTIDERAESGFELLHNGTREDQVVLAVELGPPGTTFASPVTVTFTWEADAQNDRFVDDANQEDTTIPERELAIWKNGCQLTRACKQGGACKPTLANTPECTGLSPLEGTCSCHLDANSFSIDVDSFSEFLLAGEVGGTPVGVTPTKLIVVDNLAVGSKAKAVYVAKDALVTKGAGSDPAAIGVTLRTTYTGTGGPVTGAFVLPTGASDGTSGWVSNTTSVAKYVNKLAPAGPAQAKVAVLRPGKLLKLVGNGLGEEPLDILGGGAPMGDVATAYCVTNEDESNCHCSSFSACSYKSIAAGTGAKLVCRTGAPDAACSALQ